MKPLNLRELNRATLARQLLLERVALDVPTAVHRLGAGSRGVGWGPAPRPPHPRRVRAGEPRRRRGLHRARSVGGRAGARDENGRELYDLRGSPRPPADTPAPLRLLGEWCDVLPTILLDGVVAGSWWWRSKQDVATLEATPFVKLTKAAKAELEREAQLALAVLEPAANRFEVDYAS